MLAFAVNGTLMRGLERNASLLDAGAVFDREAHTAPSYRLWSIDDVHPAMLRVTAGGASIAVEIWLVPPAGIAVILLSEPDGLCIGRLTLEDGSEVLGVLAEPALVEGRREITEHGGWRAYVAANAPAGQDVPRRTDRPAQPGAYHGTTDAINRALAGLEPDHEFADAAAAALAPDEPGQ